MAAQLDLFAANQLNLLVALPAPAPAQDSPAMGPRRLSNMPPSVAAKWARAFTAEVRQAFLDVAMAQPGEWIEASHFYRAVAVPFDIGCCWGHAMGSMVRAHMLEERPRHYGSKSPAEGNYLGYTHLYRWHPPMPGVAHA